MKAGRQTTLGDRAVLTGRGVHSNSPVRVVIHPAPANSGIDFLRTGLDGGGSRRIEARWSEVYATRLCTVLGEARQASVATVEHLMAALSGLRIDNAIIEVDGPEMPIMDGSSQAFVEAIDAVGVVSLSAGRRYIRILKPVRVDEGKAFSELRPSANATNGFRLDVEIDYPTAVIGRQRKTIDLEPGVFRRDVAAARTFGFLRDVEQLWKAGFALGSSLANSIGLGDDGILNPEGLRFPDEFVRHKLLDAIGDLALAGAPIIGAFRSYCGGHRMNVAVLEALFADDTAWEFVEQAPPAPRRETSYAGFSLATAAAFAMDAG